MLCLMRQGPRGGMNVSNVSAMLGDQMEAGGKVNVFFVVLLCKTVRLDMHII